MSLAQASSACFPKSARLLKPADFRFRSYRRFESPLFKFLYSNEGTGRMGISISKKVLRRATARNRVRRLLKETFRHHRSALNNSDVHVIGLPGLEKVWRDLSRGDIESVFGELCGRSSAKR
jgi:ribonuclease P protein component